MIIISSAVSLLCVCAYHCYLYTSWIIQYSVLKGKIYIKLTTLFCTLGNNYIKALYTVYIVANICSQILFSTQNTLTICLIATC